MNYKIEEQFRSRPSSTLHNYPPVQWSDYLDSPDLVPLSTTLPNYEVHEVYSVNVPIGMSLDDIMTNATEAGLIPDLPKLDNASP